MGFGGGGTSLLINNVRKQVYIIKEFYFSTFVQADVNYIKRN